MVGGVLELTFGVHVCIESIADDDVIQQPLCTCS